MRRAAEQANARAWVFARADQPALHTEFIEWQAHSSDALTDQHELAFALQALNAQFTPEETATWNEAKI